MKNKKIKMTLNVALIASFYVVFAVIGLANRSIGDITVFSIENAVSPTVKVNGEVINSGRSLLDGSVIATDENSGAIINVRGIGKVELAPNSLVSLSVEEKGLYADLSSGKLTVLEGNNVRVKTADNIVSLNAGESATTQQTQTNSPGNTPWLLWALLLGGAAAVVIAVAAGGNNEIQIGGGTTIVSPTR